MQLKKMLAGVLSAALVLTSAFPVTLTVQADESDPAPGAEIPTEATTAAPVTTEALEPATVPAATDPVEEPSAAAEPTTEPAAAEPIAPVSTAPAEYSTETVYTTEIAVEDFTDSGSIIRMLIKHEITLLLGDFRAASFAESGAFRSISSALCQRSELLNPYQRVVIRQGL